MEEKCQSTSAFPLYAIALALSFAFVKHLPAAVCCPAEFVGGVLLAPPSRVVPSVPQPRFQAAVAIAGVPLPGEKTVDDLYPVSPAFQGKRRTSDQSKKKFKTKKNKKFQYVSNQY